MKFPGKIERGKTLDQTEKCYGEEIDLHKSQNKNCSTYKLIVDSVGVRSVGGINLMPWISLTQVYEKIKGVMSGKK